MATPSGASSSATRGTSSRSSTQVGPSTQQSSAGSSAVKRTDSTSKRQRTNAAGLGLGGAFVGDLEEYHDTSVPSFVVAKSEGGTPEFS